MDPNVTATSLRRLEKIWPLGRPGGQLNTIISAPATLTLEMCTGFIVLYACGSWSCPDPVLAVYPTHIEVPAAMIVPSELVRAAGDW